MNETPILSLEQIGTFAAKRLALAEQNLYIDSSPENRGAYSEAANAAFGLADMLEVPMDQLVGTYDSRHEFWRPNQSALID